MIVLYAVCAATLVFPLTAAAQSDLERARTLYNQGRFEEAIAAANDAKAKPAAAASATLITARSRLERYRKTADAQDLASARAELTALNPRLLTPQEAIEWQVGVGIALFLENHAGAAAEAFTTVMPAARAQLTGAEYEKLLEWWGNAASQAAEALTGDARHHAYEKLREGAGRELERNPLSRPATYWMVVGTRGIGDLEAAWAAAIAGWIRAGLPPDGEPLRADLERFVTQTLIPERAQARTGQRLDSPTTVGEVATLTEEWREITSRWIP